jgi:hypothetical protein
MYVAILSVDNIYANIILVDDNYNAASGVVTKTRDELVTLIKTNSLKPVNFSVDRTGALKEDAGSFKRFEKTGVGIVVAEIQNSYGRNLGYRLIQSTTGNLVNMKTDEIVAKEKALGRPFLQNGIVRNNTVNCYPLHSFPVIKLQRESKVKAPQVEKSKPTKTKSPYTKEQISELNLCRGKGINTSFIENPELTPEQMRICWVAKSKGILSEYFARPEYSVEVMKFYADRLVSKVAVKECTLMLRNPELKVPELSELYLCICDGVDYSSVINDSADKIRVHRNKCSIFTEEYDEEISFDKALDVARKLKGWD